MLDKCYSLHKKNKNATPFMISIPLHKISIWLCTPFFIISGMNRVANKIMINT
jgi:hypothetical protein